MKFYTVNDGDRHDIFIPQPLRQIIQRYLAEAGRLDPSTSGGYVFAPLSDRAARLPQVTADGSPDRHLSPREFHRILARYARLAGLEAGQVNSRVLRRTSAHLHQLTGAGTTQIGQLLGHANQRVTRRYLSDSQAVDWASVASILGIDEHNT